MLLGVTYKRDVNDIRESPALDIIGLLAKKGANVSYNDPYVPSFAYLERQWKSQPLNEERLQNQDCVLITTDHSKYNWEFVVKHSKLIFDTRNATKGIRDKYRNIGLL